MGDMVGLAVILLLILAVAAGAIYRGLRREGCLLRPDPADTTAADDGERDVWRPVPIPHLERGDERPVGVATIEATKAILAAQYRREVRRRRYRWR